jgi:hypothetical protein
MTKRSSFVIPPDLAGAAAIVDILDRSPKLLMQSLSPCADLLPDGYMELQIQGNIAVKALPIRLLALCTAMHQGSMHLRPVGRHVFDNVALHNPSGLTASWHGGTRPLPRSAWQGTIAWGQLSSQAITIWSRVCRNHFARE